MFGDKTVTTLFEFWVKKTTEMFGHIDCKAADRINRNCYMNVLITSGTAEQVTRFMGEPCEATGTWMGSITTIMVAGGFKFKAMVFSNMDDPEVEGKLGGAVLGVHWSAKEDIMAVSP